MRRLAARQNVVGVEVVAHPVEVQNPTVVVPVEIRDVEVAVGIAQKYVMYRL